MQNELRADYPELAIQILGVNETGYESANAAMTQGQDIPWLQDLDNDGDDRSDVWTSWNVTLRDVVILNAENEKVGTFNLNMRPLEDPQNEDPQNYDDLRQMLIDAASVVPEPGMLALLAVALTAGLLWRHWAA